MTSRETQVLINARELISDPTHWCQNAVAANARGERVEAESPEAVQFCAVGAVIRAMEDMPSGDTNFGQIANRLDVAARQIDPDLSNGYSVFIELNNNRGHADVLRMFDLAIEGE